VVFHAYKKLYNLTSTKRLDQYKIPERATNAMFQKNPEVSLVHPIIGAPDCVFLIAGRAKSKPVAKPIKLGSTLRSLNQIVDDKVKTVMESTHMLKITN
jgi:hypothetical protein